VLINVYGIRLTARLSDFSVWWHVGGVLVIVLALALLGAITTTHASSCDT
jgi:amino acid transporter